MTVQNEELADRIHRQQKRHLEQLQTDPVQAEALKALQASSGPFLLKTGNGRLSFIAGRRIGGISLPGTRDGVRNDVNDSGAIKIALGHYFDRFAALYGLQSAAEVDLRVERVKRGSTLLAKVQQYLGELPVADLRFTVSFDATGTLQQVTGGPLGAAELELDLTPELDQNEAIKRAVDHLAAQPRTSSEPITEDQFEVEVRLAVIGRQRRLVWILELNSRKDIYLSRDVQVDAHSGEILYFERIMVDATRSIPVTRYRHPGGVLNSSGDTETVDINVDTEDRFRPGFLPFFFLRQRRYSLQRLGSGRARLWNAHYNGTTHPPSFSRTWTDWATFFSRDHWSTRQFTQTPGGHSANVFNEQQTYYYSQLLKTYVDDWGRRPNSYGHYPVNDDRAVNVDIIVNADASMELSWAGDSVMHGGFKHNVSASWFDDYPEDKERVPTVFLFNSAGNSGSPQFFGPEYSSSYSIIAHEVGHFISWTYGGWSGPAGTTLGRSLNEGFSMVFPALVGKRRWPTLAYTDSAEVTTGSFIGSGQWSHHVPGTPALKYSAMSCSDNAYHLGWPFTQAMWNLLHNQDKNGDPIWATADAAMNNTAALFMYGLYHYTDDSTMTWDTLVVGLLVYMWLHFHGEQGELPSSLVRAWDVFEAHGLLEPCT